jgi:hypothetical protein
MRRPELFLMFVLAVGFVSYSAAASLDKAKTLRSNSNTKGTDLFFSNKA